ncbi:hypothetical protein N665_2166s0003 [Sinapis alba]|nr:hypothetical protein N665_2166s0003 [Sinapis alba]
MNIKGGDYETFKPKSSSPEINLFMSPSGFAKVEPLTIAELCQFIITTEPQAHMRPLISENVWCYISCSKCAKKLRRSASLFACMFCNQTNLVGGLRCCLEMTVADDSDEAVFVKFLCEITKLANILAADAGHLLDYDRGGLQEDSG